MNDAFPDFLKECQAQCERALEQLLAPSRLHEASAPADIAGLIEAARYGVTNGGKRVRPVLVYGAARAIAPELELARLDHVITAIELVHSYSLVHDDLPAMDDDDLRRGKPSLHKAYDEATAILVGDGLQALAFELLASAPGLDAQCRVNMVQSLAAAAGCAGMVGGQYIDIEATDSSMSLAQLQTMHSLKTGALIRCALALGGLAAGAGPGQLDALDNYGRDIGLAFQVVDDILDVTGDTASLGKTQGKDEEANKATYVRLLGLEGAREEAEKLLQSATDSLAEFGASGEPLRGLARYIVSRDR